MLFNKSNTGADELKEILGTYYASNNFANIKPFILIEERNIRDLVGAAVYTRAQSAYDADEPEALEKELLEMVRFPIAVLSQMRYSQANLVSHEDSGRKFKIDPENEKMPWEWMLDRDDQAHLRMAFEGIDNLIEFLDNQRIDEWINSEAYKKSKSCFITDTDQFNDIYSIDGSRRFYYAIVPLMTEIERRIIKPILGERFDQLHDELQSSSGISEASEDLYNLICYTVPLFTMILAAQRFNISVMPEGVSQRILSESESRNATKNVSQDTLKAYINSLQPLADEALNEVKLYLASADPEAKDYPIVPNNSPDNKHFRT